MRNDDFTKAVAAVILIVLGIVAIGRLTLNKKVSEQPPVVVTETRDWHEDSSYINIKKNFKINNLDDKTLAILDTDEEKLTRLIKNWMLHKEKYISTESVTIDNEYRYDPVDKKYTFFLKTVVGQEFDDKEQTFALMYYKETHEYVFL